MGYGRWFRTRIVVAAISIVLSTACAGEAPTEPFSESPMFFTAPATANTTTTAGSVEDQVLLVEITR